MNLPPIVSAAEWQIARDDLLAKEKAATRALDTLAAERRRLPMVHIAKDYVFQFALRGPWICTGSLTAGGSWSSTTS